MLCDVFLFFAGLILGWVFGCICGWIIEKLKINGK